MITVADKSLERPIKVTLYYHWSTVLLLSVITQAGLFETTSVKISAQGSRLRDRTRRYIWVSLWKCWGISKRFSLSFHTCTAVNAHIQTSTINRLLSEMLCIVISFGSFKGRRDVRSTFRGTDIEPNTLEITFLRSQNDKTKRFR